MDLENSLDKLYSTQHFGFHSRSFLDKIYNDFYECLLTALTELKQHLVKLYSDKMPAKDIEANTETLFKKLVEKLDCAMDRLELYLDINIFQIPKHVVLPEDKVHMTHPCTTREDEKLDIELEVLKQRILEERAHKCFLKAKVSEQKLILENFDLFENKLQQILTVVNESRLTKDDLKVTMEKCLELSKEFEEPMKID